VPFVVLGTRPGLEIVHPMAVVLLGGVFTATVVSLFLLPAVYPRVAVQPEPGPAVAGALVREFTGVEPDVVRVAGDGHDGADTDGDGDGRPARDARTEP
jgi:hypothetical protein